MAVLPYKPSSSPLPYQRSLLRKVHVMIELIHRLWANELLADAKNYVGIRVTGDQENAPGCGYQNATLFAGPIGLAGAETFCQSSDHGEYGLAIGQSGLRS